MRQECAARAEWEQRQADLREQYEMLFDGQRHTVSASRYGPILRMMTLTGWSYAECREMYEEAPFDLWDEYMILLEKQAAAQKSAAKPRRYGSRT